MTQDNIVRYEVVDYSEGGFFGKPVCKSNLTAMTDDEKLVEKLALTLMFPGYSIVEVIEVPAAL